MKQYLDLAKKIMTEGTFTLDRSGCTTKMVFGETLKFPIQRISETEFANFPALTTKKLAWKSVVSELLWFLEGSSNERRLAEILYEKPRSELTDKRTIWTDNFENQAMDLGYRNGELGPVYGYQWRNWLGNRHVRLGPGEMPVTTCTTKIDQIENLITSIKQEPFSRRHVVSAWNVGELVNMSLPPCHVLFQVNVYPDDNGNPADISLLWFQRSADVGLGLPFDIATYGLLLCMIANLTNLNPRELICMLGSAQIYSKHYNAIREQIMREPYPLPVLKVPEFSTLNELNNTKTSDYVLKDYQCHETIKMEMIV